MPELELWQIFVTLGVPGLALGIFYMLFRKINFQFLKVPRKYVAFIAILFMVLVAGVVVYTLTLWVPDRHASNNEYTEADPIQDINRYFKELVNINTTEGPIRDNAKVNYVITSVLNICKSTRNLSRAVSALRGFTLPSNPDIFRLVSVHILTELVQKRADGQHASYKGGFLSNLDLSDLEFRSCEFHQADFSRVRFVNTIFDGCWIDTSDFSGASFFRAELHNVVIGQSNFEDASFKNSTFDAVILAELNMSSARFEQCWFSDSTLFATEFLDSYFLQPTFERVNIIASNFRLPTLGGHAFWED